MATRGLPRSSLKPTNFTLPSYTWVTVFAGPVPCPVEPSRAVRTPCRRAESALFWLPSICFVLSELFELLSQLLLGDPAAEFVPLTWEVVALRVDLEQLLCRQQKP